MIWPTSSSSRQTLQQHCPACQHSGVRRDSVAVAALESREHAKRPTQPSAACTTRQGSQSRARPSPSSPPYPAERVNPRRAAHPPYRQGGIASPATALHPAVHPAHLPPSLSAHAPETQQATRAAARQRTAPFAASSPAVPAARPSDASRSLRLCPAIHRPASAPRTSVSKGSCRMGGRVALLSLKAPSLLEAVAESINRHVNFRFWHVLFVCDHTEAHEIA